MRAAKAKVSSTPAPLPAHHWRWTRPIAPRWTDAWLERIAFVGADRLTVVEKPGVKIVRLEAYPENEKTGRRLVKHFGGRLRKVLAASWLKKSEPAAPIRFGRKLVVAGGERPPAEAFPGATILSVPAGLAFGTGQHATTGMILRELGSLQVAGIRALDAGTGSGILALALRGLGAARVEAFDYDPTAIRIAKENERLNFQRPSIAWDEVDFLKWKSPAVYDVICANLFSELLVQRAKVLARALKPGCLLLVSGILNIQAASVQKALREAGLVEEKWKKRGKWSMARWRKPENKRRRPA